MDFKKLLENRSDRLLALGFFAALVLLITIGLGSSLGNRQVTQATNERAAARQNMLDIEILFSTLRDLEI
jgi:CHASE3 domain sensor protein